ncbi:hypothetical protein AB4Z55_27535 [Gordonia sp. ABKF26]|uniref:hypothetical protein n=1 Tax=Gordonia sp. ABKF26 TaxID=3238687 RepID=UPI0034E38ECD
MTDWRSDPREREDMIAFALRWAPFGGGSSEDIWVRFGIPERVFFHRLHRVLAAAPPPGLDDTAWQRLRRVCEHRLASTSAP